MRQRLVVQSGLLFIGVIGWAGSASAYVVRGVSNNNENIYIGMVDVAGDGTSSRVPVVCVDNTGAGGDPVPRIIGNASGLSQSSIVHGDSTDTGTGNDLIGLIATNGTFLTGYCQSAAVVAVPASSSWNRLTHNGYYLDIYGDGGNDTINAGYGPTSTYLQGNGNDDWVYGDSPGAFLYGNDGADTLWATSASSATERLWGGNGDDCLWDASDSFTTFDCGAGANRYGNNTGVSPTCQTHDSCCGFC